MAMLVYQRVPWVYHPITSSGPVPVDFPMEKRPLEPSKIRHFPSHYVILRLIGFPTMGQFKITHNHQYSQ